MSEFFLPKRKVLIKPIIREGKWLPKGHSGAFMYDFTKMSICVPLDRATGLLIDPLTKEEREFFENKELSGMSFEKGDLSIYKKDNKFVGQSNYWHTFEFRIIKDQGVVDDNTTLDILDLSLPMDYIKYKVLLANSGLGGIVAPTWDARFDQASYKIALVDSGYGEASKANRAEILIKAYDYFKDLNKSQEKMFDFLNVWWLENKKALKPAKDATPDWLRSQIQILIESDPKKFLEVVASDYEEKLLIHRAMLIGAVSREGDLFLTADSKPMGRNIREAILYLRDERNQEDKFKLIALLGVEETNSKKKK